MSKKLVAHRLVRIACLYVALGTTGFATLGSSIATADTGQSLAPVHDGWSLSVLWSDALNRFQAITPYGIPLWSDPVLW